MTNQEDGNGRKMASKLNNAANWTFFIHDELTEQISCLRRSPGGGMNE